MKPTPKDWPRLSSSLVYQDAAAAIDWLCKAFGFSVRIRVESDDGHIVHSELTYGGGLIMIAQEQPESPRHWKGRFLSPKTLGGFTQSLYLYVDDVEAHFAQARAQGAKIVMEPETHDYGAEYWTDRSYSCEDLEGHLWSIAERVRN
jgi:uncharacterized glyoxalase superfamily protein PhnB